MKLNAPTHLRGRFHSGTPKHFIPERSSWVIEKLKLGFSQNEIADALDISDSTVSRIVSASQYTPEENFDLRKKNNILSITKVRRGTGTELVHALTEDEFNKLFDLAAKQKTSFILALLNSWRASQ